MATSKRTRRSKADQPANSAEQAVPVAGADAPTIAAQPEATASAPTTNSDAPTIAAQPEATASAPTTSSDAPTVAAQPEPAAPKTAPTVIGAEPGPLAPEIYDAPTLLIERPVARPVAPKLADEPPAASTPAGPVSAAPRPAQPAAGLAEERAAIARRRTVAGAGIGIVVLVAALLGYRALASQGAATAPAPTGVATAPTSAPAAAAPTTAPAPTAAPALAAPTSAPAPTAAPAAAAPTSAPASAAAPAAAAPTSAPASAAAPAAPLACNAIAGLPVFAGATCVDTDTDTDNGVIKLKNTYAAAASADDIRRFYEGAFGQGGWTLSDFSYDINLGQRSLKIDVETEQGASGTFTKVRLSERRPASAPATDPTTCAPIEGLPAYSGATCTEPKADVDDGMLEVKNTYSTTASPAEVLGFYAGHLAQQGWASQSAAYDLRQGARRVQIEAENHETQANAAKLKIEEK